MAQHRQFQYCPSYSMVFSCILALFHGSFAQFRCELVLYKVHQAVNTIVLPTTGRRIRFQLPCATAHSFSRLHCALSRLHAVHGSVACCPEDQITKWATACITRQWDYFCKVDPVNRMSYRGFSHASLQLCSHQITFTVLTN